MANPTGEPSVSGIEPSAGRGGTFPAALPSAPPPTYGYRPTPSPRPHESRLVLLVVILVVVFVVASVASAFVLQSLEGGLTSSHPGSIPIGAAFAAGNPVRSMCPAGGTFAVVGCAATHYRYLIGVESSTVGIGDLWFRVTAANGSVAYELDALGFTVLNASQVVLAQFAVTGGFLTMGSSAWTYSSGTSASTALLTTDSIMIDFGNVGPTGQPLTLVAYGVGSYSGTTAALTLYY